MANEDEDEDGGLGGNQKRRGVVVWLRLQVEHPIHNNTPFPGPPRWGFGSLSGFFRFRVSFVSQENGIIVF